MHTVCSTRTNGAIRASSAGSIWAGEPDRQGWLVHRAGGSGGATWLIDYDRDTQADDETGYRLGAHRFQLDEYVSIRDDDGDLHTFKVAQLTAVARAPHGTGLIDAPCPVARRCCASSSNPQPRRKVRSAGATSSGCIAPAATRRGVGECCRSRRRSDSPPLSGGDAGRSPGGGHHDRPSHHARVRLDPAQINDVIAYLQSLAT